LAQRLQIITITTDDAYGWIMLVMQVVIHTYLLVVCFAQKHVALTVCGHGGQAPAEYDINREVVANR
jgi:hypothetical protein